MYEGFQRFDVPLGTVSLLRHPESGQILLEVDEEMFFGSKDWQYMNPKNKKWVKLDFKQTFGQFKGVTVREI